MTTLEWTQALSVGVEEIDAQHRELFRRAARLLEGIRGGEPEELGQLFDFLHEYAVEPARLAQGLREHVSGTDAELGRFLVRRTAEGRA
ncbi:MAG TPA: hypothetical protein VF841_14355 [Anaeromyxobacter sp.]